jgi:hypothetical protein
LASLYDKATNEISLLQSFVDYWLIWEYGSDPRFAYNIDIAERSRNSLEKMYQETRSRLSAACKDLICLPLDATEPQLSIMNLPSPQFFHRTVCDFIQSPEIQSMIQAELPEHFQGDRIFHLLNLAKLKTIASAGSLQDRQRFVEMITRISVDKVHPDRNEEFVLQVQEVTALLLPQSQQGPATDSGYASMGKADNTAGSATGNIDVASFDVDDTASVYSQGTLDGSYDLADDRKIDYASAFAQSMIENMNTDGLNFATDTDRISGDMANQLRDFSRILRRKANDSTKKQSIAFIRKERRSVKSHCRHATQMAEY